MHINDVKLEKAMLFPILKKKKDLENLYIQMISKNQKTIMEKKYLNKVTSIALDLENLE